MDIRDLFGTIPERLTITHQYADEQDRSTKRRRVILRGAGVNDVLNCLYRMPRHNGSCSLSPSCILSSEYFYIGGVSGGVSVNKWDVVSKKGKELGKAKGLSGLLRDLVSGQREETVNPAPVLLKILE